MKNVTQSNVMKRKRKKTKSKDDQNQENVHKSVGSKGFFIEDFLQIIIQSSLH